MQQSQSASRKAPQRAYHGPDEVVDDDDYGECGDTDEHNFQQRKKSQPPIHRQEEHYQDEEPAGHSKGAINDP
jgi:hypothetical protein